MSCGNQKEQDDAEDPIPITQVSATPTLCARCKILSPTIILRNTGYCADCFETVFTTKFKSGIAPARNLSQLGTASEVRGSARKLDRSSILLAFSGGENSRTMLDLILTYFVVEKDNSNGRFIKLPMFSGLEVLYVDHSAVSDNRINSTKEVKDIVEKAGAKFSVIKIEDAFVSTSASESITFDPASLELSASTSTSTTTPLESLLSLLKPHGPTSRSSLLSSILHSLLRKTAIERGHEILFTGENANRIAVKVLSGLAEGRGWNMGEEVGAFWEGNGLMQVRPLSLSLRQEITYYNKLKQLDFIPTPIVSTAATPREAGIESLTTEFVNGLELNFPDTVSTVIRTAGKLGLRSSDDTFKGRTSASCPICGLPAQAEAQEWRKANTISSLESSRSSTPLPPSLPPLSTLSETSIPLAKLLCYGCLLIYQDVQQSKKVVDSELVRLPGYSSEVVKQRLEADVLRRRTAAEKVVGEYLLD